MSTIATLGACAWCGHPFRPNSIGRPRRYCSVGCRTEHGHYVEALPGLTARLAELEASAARYRHPPNFITTEIAEIRASIAKGTPSSDRV